VAHENVELVRRAYDVLNRWAADPRVGSLGGADAAEVLHPDIEFWTDAASPEAGVYRGRDAVLAYNQNLFGSFENVRIEVEEVVSVRDRVLVVSRQHAVPRSGEAVMTVQVVEVWTVRDGLLAERRTFRDRGEALEVLG
jgi:ketosteroid isomerase-like protein